MDPDTPDAWFDMVINLFIRSFPILKVHTPNMSVHIWTTRLDDERLVHPELFPTMAYLEMKRVRNPRSEGKRIFRNLMELPPLDNIEGASDMVDASSETSDNMSFEASDNTTSDELEDSSNNADNEVLDSMSSNNADNMTSNNIEVDIVHASDNMDDSSSDGVLDTSTNIQAYSDILHADNMELDNMQSSSDNVDSDNMQSSSDNVASDNMTSDTMSTDNMASDTMTSDNVDSDSQHGTSDNMASDSLHGTSDNMASDTMAQIKDETNLYKRKLIWVGRNMPSKIRVVPPVRIDMAKKKLIWVKRKLNDQEQMKMVICLFPMTVKETFFHVLQLSP
ncbi:uncharacterized protein TNCV_3536361 [Trichonephila clavipes]|uniref:Uncharacterized protein n=1 Tax=Trichonephila clavipes TaxID=2585209 RepID=A0A8X6VWG5_TRICX|nr:uncharacterized protein TNCV_3536361 [Trichonephila clavipes]